MSEIENAGSKGYCLMWLIISVILFVLLLIYLYQGNFVSLPAG